MTDDHSSGPVPPHGAAANPVARPPRASVMLSATVERFGGGAPTHHRVRDLSPGGIRIDQAAGMRVGATVLITVGALEAIGATVRWEMNGSAGLAFAEQIDPERARTRAAIAPRPAKAPVRIAAPPPGAGWVTGLRSPYR